LPNLFDEIETLQNHDMTRVLNLQFNRITNSRFTESIGMIGKRIIRPVGSKFVASTSLIVMTHRF